MGSEPACGDSDTPTDGVPHQISRPAGRRAGERDRAAGLTGPAGSFFPCLLEPCTRVERTLVAVRLEAYMPGGLPRRLAFMIRALRTERISTSQLFAALSGAGRRGGVLLDQAALAGPSLYVWLDPLYKKMRNQGRGMSQAIVARCAGCTVCSTGSFSAGRSRAGRVAPLLVMRRGGRCAVCASGAGRAGDGGARRGCSDRRLTGTGRRATMGPHGKKSIPRR
jgi:hypothetical protein